MKTLNLEVVQFHTDFAMWFCSNRRNSKGLKSYMKENSEKNYIFHHHFFFYRRKSGFGNSFLYGILRVSSHKSIDFPGAMKFY